MRGVPSRFASHFSPAPRRVKGARSSTSCENARRAAALPQTLDAPSQCAGSVITDSEMRRGRCQLRKFVCRAQ